MVMKRLKKFLTRYKLDPHWQWMSLFYDMRPKYFPFRWMAILRGRSMMSIDPTIHCFKVLSAKPGETYFQGRFPDVEERQPDFYKYCK